MPLRGPHFFYSIATARARVDIDVPLYKWRHLTSSFWGANRQSPSWYSYFDEKKWRKTIRQRRSRQIDVRVHLIVVVYFACAVFFMVRVNYTWTTLLYIHNMRVFRIWWLTWFSCMTWKHFMYVTYSEDHQWSSAGNKTVVYTFVRELFSLAPCCQKQQSSFLLCKVWLIYAMFSSHQPSLLTHIRHRHNFTIYIKSCAIYAQDF